MNAENGFDRLKKAVNEAAFSIKELSELLNNSKRIKPKYINKSKYHK